MLIVLVCRFQNLDPFTFHNLDRFNLHNLDHFTLISSVQTDFRESVHWNRSCSPGLVATFDIGPFDIATLDIGHAISRVLNRIVDPFGKKPNQDYDQKSQKDNWENANNPENIFFCLFWFWKLDQILPNSGVIIELGP